MINYNELTLQHGWSPYEFKMAKMLSTVYREFDCGLVILSDLGRFYALTSCAIDNKYSLEMWKLISSLLKNREKPIVTSYSANQDKLFKASKKYGGIRCDDNIAYFHVDGFDDVKEIYIKD